MRLVLDLQGAQSASRFRGIGRYSLAFAQSLAREARQHEVWLALNGQIPDSIEPLREAFADLVPREHVRVFEFPMPVAELDTANGWRMQTGEFLREKFLADLCPDVVHLSTLFEGFHNEAIASVGRLDNTVPTAVTLYDLIPLLNSERYLPDPLIRRFYFRRLQSLKRADLLLAISESSRQEAIGTLQISPERITTITPGLSESFLGNGVSDVIRPERLAHHGLRRPFVMYTGGDDSRKNLESLIAAFALLPKDVRAAHQLALVCHFSEGFCNRLTAVAKEHRLNADEMVCTGYVPDEDLRLLYSTCSVFVFPSFHEGFGLPVLEAMACGAPVIGSNRTSIPEIITRDDALFDPYEPRDIARRIAAVLLRQELRQSLKTWGAERAKAFTWEASARKAMQAFEELHANRKKVRSIATPVAQGRPPLAFVAPLPPARTGIAGYCAKLVPNLAQYYEITCIIDQPEVMDPWITAEFPIRDLQWFEAHAGRFERILYQFGNSSLHQHMFALLERHPGIVVLHDFYLGDLLNWMTTCKDMPGCYTKALYDSHGFSALEKNRSAGCEATTTAYPCNAAVLRDSVGVIVHSEYAIQLARKWYGDQVTVLMRRIPFFPFPPQSTDRLAARTRLGLPENAFVVSSFGLLTPAKLNQRLLDAWLASSLSLDEASFLVFVGENQSGDYAKKFLEKIAGNNAASRIRITGYLEEPDYRDYLAATDLAVQLRTRSRGETSAALFDCLSRNVPLVVNAHGSAAELPDDVVMKLDDDFADAALSAALTRMRTETELRQNFAQRGALYLNEQHHPERVAELYHDTIEELYHTTSVAREQRLLGAIARTSTPALPSDSDLVAVAKVIVANRPRIGLRQMLVDVSELAQSDARSGIQRVTRAILKALISDPPPGYRIEPVRAVGDGYVYARRFACQSLHLPHDGLSDDPVGTSPDDIFLGLDLSISFVPSLKPWFLNQRRHGTEIIFVVYDLLALLRPEFFPLNLPPVVLDWFNTVTEVADGLICISRSVADELHAWLARSKPERLQQSIAIGFFHLGADLRATLPTQGLAQDATELLSKLRSRPSLLMVGTLEPRKAHRQALEAVEQLWTDGVDLNLIIVGKKGWRIDELSNRIQQHAEYGNRLFWLQAISDQMLEEVYRNSRALLAPSEGEGFGLPLIEAAHYRLPIIARDIPVFREVAREHAYYFSGKDAKSLADALRQWLALGANVPASTGIPWLTWHQSSRQLLEVVLEKCWYSSWSNARTADPSGSGASNKSLSLIPSNQIIATITSRR
jgi:glycosyltransferase involved in cell wall biosynthesis